MYHIVCLMLLQAKFNDVSWFPVGHALSLRVQAGSVTVDNSKLVAHSISNSLQRLERSVQNSMAEAIKIMDRKVALEMGAPYGERIEARGPKNSAERSRGEGRFVLPDVVTEILERAKVRSMYER